jgi:hypothetical protein
LAGVAGASPLGLLGCKSQPTAEGTVKPLVAAPAPAAVMRVFFSGSWLFCADSTAGSMRAVAVDFPQIKHSFPYGIWTSAGIDGNGRTLPPSTTPYPVKVGGFTPAAGATVDALFAATLCQDPFSYIQNKTNDLSINFKRNDIRSISLPIPSRIISAAFLVGASVQDSSGEGLLATPGAGCAAPRVDGVPTCFIFEYDQGTSVTFTQPNGQNETANAGQNYHFHTSPSDPTQHGHGPMMFADLMGIIQSKSGTYKPTMLSLINVDDCLVTPGPDVPAGISNAELEIGTSGICANGAAKASAAQATRKFTVMAGTLGSCAGGGGGLGGDCGC